MYLIYAIYEASLYGIYKICKTYTTNQEKLDPKIVEKQFFKGVNFDEICIIRAFGEDSEV